eukprot:scaffold7243_cov394-Prasinococcus_capsulatus_cf.AAC.24
MAAAVVLTSPTPRHCGRGPRSLLPARRGADERDGRALAIVEAAPSASGLTLGVRRGRRVGMIEGPL